MGEIKEPEHSPHKWSREYSVCSQQPQETPPSLAKAIHSTHAWFPEPTELLTSSDTSLNFKGDISQPREESQGPEGSHSPEAALHGAQPVHPLLLMALHSARPSQWSQQLMAYRR